MTSIIIEITKITDDTTMPIRPSFLALFAFKLFGYTDNTLLHLDIPIPPQIHPANGINIPAIIAINPNVLASDISFSTL